MTKISLLSLIILTLSNFAHASEFKFNNKNLNSLGALICQASGQGNTTNILAHKVNINKYRNSDLKNDYRFEVVGTCDIQYNTKTNKIVSLGDEFILSFNAKSPQQIEGKLGIKNLFFNFRKNNLHSLVIVDPLMQTTKRIYLSQSQWANSDTILNFNQPKLKVKISRKTAAVENNSLLQFNDSHNTKFFNLWSFESFGCSSKNSTMNLETCQKIVSEIN